MEKLEGTKHSFWRTTAHGVSYPKLSNDLEVDVAVIGGGISGVLAAYFLAKSGKSVALLEAREIGAGCTGGTTAKLSSQHQLIYHDLVEKEGLEIAKQYFNANQKGRELIESLVNEHSIDCDFEKMDAYVFSQDGSHTESLVNEAKAYKEIGIDGEMTETIPLEFKVKSSLVMRNQAQFHPMKFLQGILREVKAMGGKVFQNTRYMESERKSEQLILSTDTPFTVTCSQLVLSTLFPVEDPHSFYSNTLKPVTSHLTAFKSDKAFNKGMYISEDTPKRTFRGTQDEDQSILIIGGDTHPTGDEESTLDRYESIRQFTKDEFELTDMVGHWSQHDLMTPDHRPYIGPIEEDDEQIYVMTGYSKWGLAVSATAAQLITDLIHKRKNPYEQLFSPQRKLPDDKEEQEDSTTDEKSISNLVSELKKGQGKKFDLDDKPAGMYKDANNHVHYVDLACTHLGCEVSWNDGDETWDCPCHGSVFDGTGKVIEGPAKLPLKHVNPF